MLPEDVPAAAHRIAAHVHRTPVLTSRRLDDRVGARVFLKCENLQRAGAFKVRGAFNALLQLAPAQAAAGVIAYSSGNHAQAIALAAGELGVPATIVMPHDAPEVKVAATKGYGADVVRYDRYAQTREQLGADLARERGLTLIPPYDHPHIIAGQGTAAAELLAQAPGLDVVLAPLGGGGLLAGTILAAREAAPAARIYGVEPEAGDDGLRSLRAGRIVHIDTPRTIADGAQTQALGEWTFPIISGGAADVLTVSDDALREAMRVLAMTTKLVAEPTGVLALAGLLTHTEIVRGGRIGVIVSGGNVDLNRYAALIATQ
ncbi:threo-3-hydroxy-L-aspartate ammonia-lyase [Pseudactinotalea sp. Z1732]|uniref:threo-3-hydroxy-L-aspartate ammonia-lyase n=1 Tax=Micrococcales TaxID=85006 RepID=UPI003C7E1432